MSEEKGVAGYCGKTKFEIIGSADTPDIARYLSLAESEEVIVFDTTEIVGRDF